VLVTGGATNIGRAITECFLRDGAHVAVGQMKASMRELVERYGDRVVPLVFDQGKPEDCRRLVRDAVRELGGLDVLVNNAALTGPGNGRPFLELEDEYIARMLDVNLKGVIHLSVEAGRIMRDRKAGGVIIHVSSINALRPQRNAAVYAATKAALGNLAQSMAKELGVFGIRVIAVAPGDIWTDTFEEVKREQISRGTAQEVIGQAVLGQGQPVDIGEAVTFLASPRARYITGVTLVVDGGLLA
jgi:NAD(P)-dependent dehydrogenase (short-subunit alcohol dehydrogenase family)